MQRNWNQLEKLLPKTNNNNNKIATLPLRGYKAAHPKRETNGREREREREEGRGWDQRRTNYGNNNDRES
jgi:DNA-binding winged helix-turn-helix (wHTH) protein